MKKELAMARVAALFLLYWGMEEESGAGYENKRGTLAPEEIRGYWKALAKVRAEQEAAEAVCAAAHGFTGCGECATRGCEEMRGEIE